MNIFQRLCRTLVTLLALFGTDVQMNVVQAALVILGFGIRGFVFVPKFVIRGFFPRLFADLIKKNIFRIKKEYFEVINFVRRLKIHQKCLCLNIYVSKFRSIA